MSEPVTLSPPDVSFEHQVHAEWDRERRAFLRLVPTLLGTHRGRYIAVHGGRAVAEGDDQIELAKRVYAEIGYVPVYVGRVTDEPAPPLRIPSPRLIRSEGT
jgi:hypothetical protein